LVKQRHTMQQWRQVRISCTWTVVVRQQDAYIGSIRPDQKKADITEIKDFNLESLHRVSSQLVRSLALNNNTNSV
jgi:hypothetical protein